MWRESIVRQGVALEDSEGRGGGQWGNWRGRFQLRNCPGCVGSTQPTTTTLNDSRRRAFRIDSWSEHQAVSQQSWLEDAIHLCCQNDHVFLQSNVYRMIKHIECMRALVKVANGYCSKRWRWPSGIVGLYCNWLSVDVFHIFGWIKN